MSKSLGTLTIGQAPRADIAPILDALLPADTIVHHAGLLDDLSHDQIKQRFAPEPGEALLTSRLLDGSSVILGKNAVNKALGGALQSLANQGCEFIVLLCTGAFDHVPQPAGSWLLEPDRILPPIVAALTQNRQAGIIVPLAEQADSEQHKWNVLARTPRYGAATPYQDDIAALSATARSLRDQGAELLVLDCMGYTERHRKAACEASGLPVILSNSLLARALAELLSNGSEPNQENAQ